MDKTNKGFNGKMVSYSFNMDKSDRVGSCQREYLMYPWLAEKFSPTADDMLCLCTPPHPVYLFLCHTCVIRILHTVLFAYICTIPKACSLRTSMNQLPLKRQIFCCPYTANKAEIESIRAIRNTAYCYFLRMTDKKSYT